MQEFIAAQRAAEASLETIHQQQAHASEQFSAVQGDVYGVGGEIARLEQAIQHARELQARQKEEFAETAAALSDLEKHLVLDRAHVEELTQALAEVEPALASAVEAERMANEHMASAEAEVQSWQTGFEKHQQQSAENHRETDLKRAEVTNLDQRMIQASRRLEVLTKETENVDTAALIDDLRTLDKEAATLAHVPS